MFITGAKPRDDTRNIAIVLDDVETRKVKITNFVTMCIGESSTPFAYIYK